MKPGLTIADRWRMLDPTARDRLSVDPYTEIPSDLVSEVERVGFPFALIAGWEGDTGPGRPFLRSDVADWILGITTARIAAVTVTPSAAGVEVEFRTTDVTFAEQTVQWTVTTNLEDRAPLYQLGVKTVKLPDSVDLHVYVFNHRNPQQFNLPPADRQQVKVGSTSLRAFYPYALLPALPPVFDWSATLNVDGIDVAQFPDS